MLPRKNRIPIEFFPGVTRGKVTQNDLFRVVIKVDNALSHPKCAVIISNKIAKTAVSRNRIRRQVYSVLETLIKKLPKAYISVFPKKTPMTPEEVASGLTHLL